MGNDSGWVLRSVQCAFFTRLDLSDKLHIGSVLRAELQDVLDGEPLVLPAFPDAPPQIPQLILRSKDQSHECTVSSARVDFRHAGQAGDSAAQAGVEHHLEIAKRLHLAICQKLLARVTRVGVATQFEARLSEQASLFIRDRFLKAEAPPGSREVQLAVLERQTWSDIDVNRWISVKSEHPSDNPAAAYVLRVGSDINSVPEIDREFDSATLERFYGLVSSFLAEDLPRFVGLRK
jgi:hypothetical protein